MNHRRITNEREQTGVEWLFEKLFNSFEKFHNGRYTLEEYLENNLEIMEQAKEMEREQKIDFCYHWFSEKEINIKKFYDKTYGPNTWTKKGKKMSSDWLMGVYKKWRTLNSRDWAQAQQIDRQRMIEFGQMLTGDSEDAIERIYLETYVNKKYETIYTSEYEFEVTDEELQPLDWCLNINTNSVFQYYTKRGLVDGDMKLIRHLPLKGAPIIQGVPLTLR